MPSDIATLREIEALEAGAAPPKPVKSSTAAITPPAQPKAKARGKWVNTNEEAATIQLPIFSSMKQAYTITGIPLSVMKDAKQAGSTAITSAGRVDLAALLRFIFSDDQYENTNWSSELKRFQAKREELRYAEDQKRVVDRSVVQSALAKGMALLLTKIDHEFGVRLPPTLKGLDESSIQQKLLAAAESFKADFRNEVQALATPVPAKVETPSESIQP